jgi:hypothetical protein
MTIDDELYLSIRIRVPQRMTGGQQSDLAAAMLRGAAGTITGWTETYITGFEATIATFRPLPDEQGQVMHFTRDKGNGDG